MAGRTDGDQAICGQARTGIVLFSDGMFRMTIMTGGKRLRSLYPGMNAAGQVFTGLGMAGLAIRPVQTFYGVSRRICIDMAIDTDKPFLMMDIVPPFLRIHIHGPQAATGG